VDNPQENELPQPLKDYLKEAVRRSGYPLQTIVAAELLKNFTVTEEWGYQDRTTQEHRTLDIFAFKNLAPENKSGLLVASSIALLMECKRSQHPFIFFKSETEQSRPLSGFPRICGVQRVEFHQGTTSREVAPSACLGLETERFSIDVPPICTSLARVGGKPEESRQHRRDSRGHDSGGEPIGKGIVLTGSDAYNSILLPLISSLDFLAGYFPVSTHQLHPTISLAVCILDAPMVLSEGGPEDVALSMVPWARLIRRERKKLQHGYHHAQHVVDFVHRYALNAFVNEVLGFATIVRERFIEKAVVFQRGHGVVNDLNNWVWSEVQPK